LAENVYLKEPANDWSPEKLFDRRWALTLLEVALKDIEAEYVEAGKAEMFPRAPAIHRGGRRAWGLRSRCSVFEV
jgi:RNA polymerase sigma-70 factor (ECF subfamily)